MGTLSEALSLATRYHQSGELQAAEQLYRQILAVDPNQAEALHQLGVLASQLGNQEYAAECIQKAIVLKNTEATFHSNLGAVFKALGNFAEAVSACRRALELKPESAAAHYNLGTALEAQGQREAAIECFQRAVELKPDYAEAYNNLGTAWLAQGKLKEAEACFRRILECGPDNWLAHHNLGAALQAQGNLEEAIAGFRQALQLRPDHAESQYRLGTALQDQGKVTAAIDCYRQVLQLKPDHITAYNRLGTALQEQGELNEAIGCFGRAIELKPDDADAYSNLGRALQTQDRVPEAVACYRRSLELDPNSGLVHYNLGTALQLQSKLEEAVESFQRAIALKPDLAEAYNSLGTVYNDQGRFHDSLACYCKALEIKPDLNTACQNRLLALQYHSEVTLAELARAHGEYERLQAAPLRSSWRPHLNDRDSQRAIRVGFLSADLREHPIGFFTIGALENLSRGQFTTVCYCDSTVDDHFTSRFRAAAAVWRDVHKLRDDELAELIRGDQIDVVFDLAGHTAKNRLLVFARKPAPIQISWAGYVGTTGLAAMDYILADRFEVPVGAENHYSERVLRMPNGYVCFDPPTDAPAVAPLPAASNGFVTFGSFNNPCKTTAQIIKVWAQILKRLRRSRFLFKYIRMNCSSVENRLAKEFASHGIAPERIEFRDWSPHRISLAEYGRVDLAVDTFPYNGGLTTCEALWMGVPVITCPGETFASRHSLSHLSNVGLTEMIAQDFNEYVDIAVALASDLPRLASIRSSLRERVAASPLCDKRRFANHLGVLLREVWRIWCRTA